MWDSFLEDITGKDKSIIDYLQMVAGMSLFGKVYEEGVILAYGVGRNGKSTLFNALGEVLGSYSGTLSIDVLTTDKQNRGAALATLRGKRLVIAGELEEGKRLSVSTIKQICSTDPITIEEKYRSPETVTPSHTLILFTNHLPRVGSTDEGTWRRLKVVPFETQIQTSIPNYASKLVEEAGPSILDWAIKGAVIFAQNGFKLTTPQAIASATSSYRHQENWLETFISECCIREPEARILDSELYQEYREWAKRSGDYVRRSVDFRAAMEAYGFVCRRPHNRKTWSGLALISTNHRIFWAG